VHPDAQALEALVADQGVNGFYHSLEARMACCQIRKVEPFKRAIAGYGAWVTGVRREQSATRAQASRSSGTPTYGLHKVSPLLEWTEENIWQYIRARKLPYNLLHDRQFPSIGCQPCTRAIQPGESRRAGRWWWEQPESRECGLHPRVRQGSGTGLRGTRLRDNPRLADKPNCMDYLPVFLQLQERPVVVVGGGRVAARKVELLRRTGARITVVAPELRDELRELAAKGELQHIQAPLLRVTRQRRGRCRRCHRTD